jgi:hypothetical protein
MYSEARAFMQRPAASDFFLHLQEWQRHLTF